MKTLKLLGKAIYSVDAIYELRKTSIWVSLIVAVLLGIMHMSPFTLMFIQDEIYRWDRSLWELDAHDEETILSALPDHCVIEKSRLTCTDFYEIKVNDHVVVQFNGNPDDLENGLVFMENDLVFIQQEQFYQLSYHALEGINFGELKIVENGYELLFNSVAQALKGELILPFILNVYQTGIVSFFTYTVMVATLSMLLKFGHSSFIRFKEVFKVIIYSSILPIFVVIVVGILLTPAFSTGIFNMGTPLVAYLVYRRKVIPGLNSTK